MLRNPHLTSPKGRGKMLRNPHPSPKGRGKMRRSPHLTSPKGRGKMLRNPHLTLPKVEGKCRNPHPCLRAGTGRPRGRGFRSLGWGYRDGQEEWEKRVSRSR